MSIHREQIAVASYNIHSGIGLDGRCRPSRIGSVLKELNCDLYALQEVDNRPGDHAESMQLDYLAAQMNMHAIPGLRIVRHVGEYGNAILTRLPLLSARIHDLSFGRYEPRGAIDIHVAVNDKPLRVIATHLGLRRSERHFQWSRLMTALMESEALNVPTIMLGDMNEWWPHASTLKATHTIFGGQPLAPAGFPSWAPCLSLTRIWVRPSAAVLSTEVHRSPTLRSASDHLPVKVTIDARRLQPLYIPHSR
ncbi:MAG: endonuclease/exonuclease/phosphatase family protein [Candidatus Obscuribacterales bacterium]|nr:endonuclease/exonuclease/phosphatase family protein [Steroidobacteraceae bacterium]